MKTINCTKCGARAREIKHNLYECSDLDCKFRLEVKSKECALCDKIVVSGESD